MKLMCGCDRGLAVCPEADQLWTDVADANHEVTAVRLQLAAEWEHKPLRKSGAVVRLLQERSFEWQQLYRDALEAFEQHIATGIPAEEQVGLFS